MQPTKGVRNRRPTVRVLPIRPAWDARLARWGVPARTWGWRTSAWAARGNVPQGRFRWASAGAWQGRSQADRRCSLATSARTRRVQRQGSCAARRYAQGARFACIRPAGADGIPERRLRQGRVQTRTACRCPHRAGHRSIRVANAWAARTHATTRRGAPTAQGISSACRRSHPMNERDCRTPLGCGRWLGLAARTCPCVRPWVGSRLSGFAPRPR